MKQLVSKGAIKLLVLDALPLFTISAIRNVIFGDYKTKLMIFLLGFYFLKFKFLSSNQIDRVSEIQILKP